MLSRGTPCAPPAAGTAGRVLSSLSPTEPPFVAAAAAAAAAVAAAAARPAYAPRRRRCASTISRARCDSSSLRRSSASCTWSERSSPSAGGTSSSTHSRAARLTCALKQSSGPSRNASSVARRLDGDGAPPSRLLSIERRCPWAVDDGARLRKSVDLRGCLGGGAALAGEGVLDLLAALRSCFSLMTACATVAATLRLRAAAAPSGGGSLRGMVRRCSVALLMLRRGTFGLRGLGGMGGCCSLGLLSRTVRSLRDNARARPALRQRSALAALARARAPTFECSGVTDATPGSGSERRWTGVLSIWIVDPNILLVMDF